MINVEVNYAPMEIIKNRKHVRENYIKFINY